MSATSGPPVRGDAEPDGQGPAAPPDARPAHPAHAGVLALALAVATVAVFDVAGHLVSLWIPGLFMVPSSGGPGVLSWVEAGCMAVALVLGLVAAMTGRGRLYGVAAIVLSVLGTGLVIQALVPLLAGSQVTIDVH